MIIRNKNEVILNGRRRKLHAKQERHQGITVETSAYIWMMNCEPEWYPEEIRLTNSVPQSDGADRTGESENNMGLLRQKPV